MVLAAQPDQVLEAVRLHESLHPLNGVGFGGVWTDVHGLDREPLKEAFQPQAGKGRLVAFFPAQLGQGICEHFQR